MDPRCDLFEDSLDLSWSTGRRTRAAGPGDLITICDTGSIDNKTCQCYRLFMLDIEVIDGPTIAKKLGQLYELQPAVIAKLKEVLLPKK